MSLVHWISRGSGLNILRHPELCLPRGWLSDQKCQQKNSKIRRKEKTLLVKNVGLTAGNSPKVAVIHWLEASTESTNRPELAQRPVVAEE